MHTIRVLSITLLVSVSSIMANYECSLSVNLIDKDGRNHRVDLLKEPSTADKKILEFAFVNGMAHGINFSRTYCSPFIPVLHDMMHREYVSTCQDELFPTEKCHNLSENIRFLELLPLMLPELEKLALETSMQLKKELPESSHINIVLTYNTPDMKADGDDEGVDTKNVSAADNK